MIFRVVIGFVVSEFDSLYLRVGGYRNMYVLIIIILNYSSLYTLINRLNNTLNYNWKYN